MTSLHRLRPRALLGLLCMALLGGACIPGPSESPSSEGRPRARPRDAEKAVLDAFDDYQIVGGFSASHGNEDVDDFLLDLVANPELPEAVDDIAIECGNALYQDVLDRYIAGDDVPLSEVRKVWRNASGAECGFSNFYENLIPLVRRVNARLSDDEKLRVLACDPPLDWSQVDSREEFEELTDREGSIASVIESEVLKKDRKALMFFGINHMRHQAGTAVGMYEEKGYDGVTYVIDDHHGFGNNDSELTKDNDELESRMADWPTPSIIRVEGSWLEELDSAYFNQPAGEEPVSNTGPPGVDAYLYVGPRDLLLREPRSAQAFLDQDYLAELRDRAARVEAPPDSPGNPDVMVELEKNGSVFSYDR